MDQDSSGATNVFQVDTDDDDDKDESCHDSNPAFSQNDPNAQKLDVLTRMFPQHTQVYLQVLAESNATLQDAIDSVLDSAQRRKGGKETASSSAIPVYLTLADVLKDLSRKIIKGPPVKVSIDQGDIIADTIAYYKTSDFDGSKRLRVSFLNQPGVDTGGLSRQFFNDAIEAIATFEGYRLFEGPDNRKLPAYNSTSVHSGLLEVLGRLIGHSILQTSIGYPCLAPPVYWYIATGDIHKALCYVTINDVRDEEVKRYIEKVSSADSATMAELNQDDRFIALCSECGITTSLSEENKNITVQSMLLYHVINRKKVLLDQLRCGLKDVNVLESIEKYPTLFEPLFIHHDGEITADAVKGLFQPKTTLTKKEEMIWGYLMSFIDKCSKEDMKAFVRFLTGCKTISAAGVRNKAIKVSFTQDGAIFSSTCLLTLQLPEEVESFDEFEVAIRVVINEGSEKSFNVV